MDIRDIQSGNQSDHFWFRARREFLQSFLNKYDDGRNQRKILVLGAGAGDDISAFQHLGEFTLSDLDPKVIEYLKGQGFENSVEEDARNLSFDDHSFDWVLAFDMIEHVDRDQDVVNEIHRVLKPGGKAFITVPAYQFLFSGHDVALGHERRYTGAKLKKLISKFHIDDFGFWNSFMLPLVTLKRAASSKSEPKIDNTQLPGLVDKLFYSILAFENSLFRKGVRLPVGVSIFTECTKK